MGEETEQEEIKNAGDLLGEIGAIDVDKFLDASQGGIDAVVGQELVVLKIAERTSSFDTGDGTFIAVKARPTKKNKNGKTVGFNASGVVMNQLRALEQHFPVRCTIEKVAGKRFNYYQIKQN